MQREVFSPLAIDALGEMMNISLGSSATAVSNMLDRRVDILKENDLWLKVRDTYLEKKNMYLRRQDHEHPSFIAYIEAVNEVYHKCF